MLGGVVTFDPADGARSVFARMIFEENRQWITADVGAFLLE